MGRRRSAAVAVRRRGPLLPRLLLVPVLCAPVLTAAPVLAHPEGLTPYRYVVAPPGVDSEGPAEQGVSVQPIGAAGFAGTTDNQMQLTLPPGALPARAGEQGVRVLLDQLDPATLPPLPDGLEAEGNAYRLSLTYARSGSPVLRLPGATLSLTAPAPPTGLLELVADRWQPVPSRTVVGDEVVSSVVAVARPGTLLQVYDPAAAPQAAPRTPVVAAPPVTTTPASAARRASRTVMLPVSAVVLAVVGLLATRQRRRRRAARPAPPSVDREGPRAA